MKKVPKFLGTWCRRSVRDRVAIVGVCFCAYIASSTFDIFEQTYNFTIQYEAYELDEMILVVVVFSFLMLIYALRRALEFKHKTVRRRDAERKAADHTLRLTTAVNNMSQGLLMFDSANRLVICNERYRQMYNLSPEMVMPGVTLLQLVNRRMQAGSF